MKVYKLKKLPVYRDDGTTPIERRIKDLEAVINQLQVQFIEHENAQLLPDVKELFEEIDPATLVQ
jgi:hypothetical protein